MVHLSPYWCPIRVPRWRQVTLTTSLSPTVTGVEGCSRGLWPSGCALRGPVVSRTCSRQRRAFSREYDCFRRRITGTILLSLILCSSYVGRAFGGPGTDTLTLRVCGNWLLRSTVVHCEPLKRVWEVGCDQRSLTENSFVNYKEPPIKCSSNLLSKHSSLSESHLFFSIIVWIESIDR